MKYLDFTTSNCKDCFKCLRECPVKAIKYENHRANIIESKCILCGKCTHVCPQNAKKVHSEKDSILEMIANKSTKVVASIAPSFVSSFGVYDFAVMEDALKSIGFDIVEETAIGAKLVTAEYDKLLKEKKFTNLITSACPAINKMIQIYYPEALKYLAPVVSPMVAHAKTIKKRYPDSKIIFIGPCIAKKREADESGIIDGVLTFEELNEIFKEREISLAVSNVSNDSVVEKAKNYPITRGIIKSFEKYPEGYEYVTIDGVDRSFDIFKDIEKLTGQFIEASCCEYSCINGPCALSCDGGIFKANEDVRKYAKSGSHRFDVDCTDIDLSCTYEPINTNQKEITEEEIVATLNKIGKFTESDEFNCGACGYSTCREKAKAVIEGNAELDMCLPYMRTRAESMSYEIIHNNPNGIVVLDNDYNIIDINNNAKKILDITAKNLINKPAVEFLDISDFVLAEQDNKNIYKKVIANKETDKYIEVTYVLPEDKRIRFGIYKDISEDVVKNRQIYELKQETFKTTDEVIKKQMRVAQEIASLLGETTAETKVALLNLKKTLDENK